MTSIELKGVQTNNLKNIDVHIPHGKITVVTGVSGSGKSSLVFDTLYAESYRRYVDSLSSYARQYMKALERPKLQSVEGLPSAIAVKQTRSGAGNRSTVGTLTELNDILRVIYSLGSVPECPNDHGPIVADSAYSIWARLFAHEERKSITVLSPLSRYETKVSKSFLQQIESQGFVRIWNGDKVIRISDVLADQKMKFENGLAGWSVVVDRFKVDGDEMTRAINAFKTALKLGKGDARVLGEEKVYEFSAHLECRVCGHKAASPGPALFNWNHPLGACNTCQGYGMEAVLDWEKIIPDLSQSIDSKGIKALNFGNHTKFYRELKKKFEGFLDFSQPFKDYSQEDWELLKFGRHPEIKKPTRGKPFMGMMHYFQWLDSKKYKAHYRMHAAKFRKYIKCTECGGDRLKKEATLYKIGGLHIGETSRLPIEKLSAWAENLSAELGAETSRLSESARVGLGDALTELEQRLDYLLQMGLEYLSLSRSSKTLSGGELQRLNMSRCLGSALTDTLFCLDEPTTGLHVRDTNRLIDIFKQLKDAGNTVVIVEHDPVIIRSADHVLEIGPEAGSGGGGISFSGPAKDYVNYLKDRKTLHVQRAEGLFEGEQPAQSKHMIELIGVTTHNLKNVTLKLPLGQFIGVCGVSGSGKSSLIHGTLYPALCEVLNQDPGGDFSESKFNRLLPADIAKFVSEVDIVSQGALGRSSRSTIATYLGVMDEIRKSLSATEAAKEAGLGPGAFSFNVPGGRCENCKGLGTVVEDLSFLGDLNVTCPECEGRRFGSDVLEVKFRGKNLTEILALTVTDARVFFFENQKLRKIFDHVISMGLGYITLAQNTSSFSGGEAQRLKLLNLLKDADRKFSQKPKILIFDEPSTGLAESDVSLLSSQLTRLCSFGHTVIVIEHHLGLLKSADWIVEVGPESAENGGQIVFSGPTKKAFELGDKLANGRSSGETTHSVTLPYFVH